MIRRADGIAILLVGDSVEKTIAQRPFTPGEDVSHYTVHRDLNGADDIATARTSH